VIAQLLRLGVSPHGESSGAAVFIRIRQVVAISDGAAVEQLLATITSPFTRQLEQQEAFTYLLVACTVGWPGVVRQLIRLGVPPDQEHPLRILHTGANSLSIADGLSEVFLPKTSMKEALLSSPSQTSVLYTPLYCALWSSQYKIVEMLIEAGADPNEAVARKIINKSTLGNEESISALALAVLRLDVRMVDLLLSFGANTKPPGPHTPFNSLVKAGLGFDNTDIVEPLQRLVGFRDFKLATVQAMIGKVTDVSTGADIHHALQIAFKIRHPNTIAFALMVLLTNANPAIPDLDGASVLNYAMEKSPAVARILLRKGIGVDDVAADVLFDPDTSPLFVSIRLGLGDCFTHIYERLVLCQVYQLQVEVTSEVVLHVLRQKNQRAMDAETYYQFRMYCMRQCNRLGIGDAYRLTPY